MAAVVEQYAAVRWAAVIAFCLAAALVGARLGAVRPDMGAGSGADRESDAAHLMMCLVMLGMLVFPTAADPHAVRGVLTAMVVVYTLVLGDRMLRWRSGIPCAGTGGDRVGAFVYHVVAAAAMLYAMSGHGPHEHGMHGNGGPAPGPMLALAALFTVDAVLMAAPGLRRRLPHVFPHPTGGAGSLAVVPHLVMDLGTAYMLVAAAAG
ncbi:DUF5134 domain-containing protein [Nocardia aurantiaca]|uniref:DUF5134 domain-containing protein n=1 Tax=Nocardia aurantiaca TaxID=2675850 RepID=A0A6I3KYW0_9NOCA|nr:DUF5134 domain-containing protein [Nocardia aurantiaca]MTE13625.1 DUF5134 domain-containing protein [Nocardia aurantiaca]